MSYTGMLEKIAGVFRQGIRKAGLLEYRRVLDDLADDVFRSQTWICSRECLGLPKGTKLFQVNVPVLRLQVAEIGGEMKVVSATPRFE